MSGIPSSSASGNEKINIFVLSDFNLVLGWYLERAAARSPRGNVGVVTVKNAPRRVPGVFVFVEKKENLKQDPRENHRGWCPGWF